MRLLVWVVIKGQSKIDLVDTLSDDHRQLMIDIGMNSVTWSISGSRRYYAVPDSSFVSGLLMVGPLIRGIDWLHEHRDIIDPCHPRRCTEVLSFCEAYVSVALKPGARIYVES